MAHRETIKAALRLARQAGGRAGVGRPRPETAPILDTGPIPGQDWAEGDIKREMSDLGSAIAEQTGVPSIYRGAQRMSEDGLANKVRGAGEIAAGVLPGASLTRAAAPLFSTLPRTIGTLSAPQLMQDAAGLVPSAQAAEQGSPKASPMDGLRQSLQNLHEQRAAQKKVMDEAKVRMEESRPKGRAPIEPYKDNKTGRMIGDPRFFDAKREYDQAAGAVDKLNERVDQAETKIATAAKQAESEAGGASLKKQEGEKSYLQQALPYAGPVVGGAMGWLGGKGVGALTKYLDKSGVETANKLLPGKTPPPLNNRVSNLNDFYMKGGSEKPPFSEAASGPPWWKANKKDVSAPHDLYPPRSRALDWGTNAGLTGVYAGEAGLGYKWGEDAHAEEKAAREAFAVDKGEGNVQRLLKAERNVEIADFMLRMGLTGALAQGVKGSVAISGSPAPRPNIAKAETERVDLRQMLAAQKTKAQAKAEKQEARGASKQKSSTPHDPNGAAHALPLTALPLVGSSGDQEPSISPSTASDIPQDFNRGGIVGQALRIAKKNGGRAGPPVMPEEYDRPESPLAPHARAFGAGAVDPMGVPSWVADKAIKSALTDWYRRRMQEARDESPLAAGAGATASLGLLGLGGLRAAGQLTTKEALEGFPSVMQFGTGVAGLKHLLTEPQRKHRPQAAYPPAGAYANGGAVHAGPIQHAADGGRTDTVPLDVASGSYVIPADIVSSLGQGDTTAGYKSLTQMFGAQGPKPAADQPVPIMAAGGEFVIAPEAVARIGKGDLKSGHEALDLWVRMQRRKTIQELKQLPGPSRD